MSSIQFAFPDDLSPFPKDTRDILRMAHDLGWSIRWSGTSKRIATIHSPVEASKQITVPSTNLNADRRRSTVRQIARYSDPDRVQDFVDSQVTVRGKSALRLALDIGPEPPKVEPKTFEQGTAVARAMREAHEAATQAAADEAAAMAEDHRLIRKANDDDEQVAALDEAERLSQDVTRSIVTTKPWMVRKGGKHGSDGTMYESPVTLERIWSDGSIDYRCKFCTYTNDKGRSVSAHASKKHTEAVGLSRKAEIRRVTNYQKSDIKHPMSAVRRMKSELLHALDSIHDWQSMDPEALTQRLAETLYEMRPDREPVAELTPEQIIARIVGLVDRGRLADMHQKVESMAAAMVEATDARNRLSTEVIEAQAEVARLREERRALASLLADSEVSS